jgi:hypothetical protein
LFADVGGGSSARWCSLWIESMGLIIIISQFSFGLQFLELCFKSIFAFGPIFNDWQPVEDIWAHVKVSSPSTSRFHGQTILSHDCSLRAV